MFVSLYHEALEKRSQSLQKGVLKAPNVKCSALTTLVFVYVSFFILSMANVNAAPPVAFGGWSETAGVISATCPANFQCINGVNDQGILQRTLRAATGEEYTQLVVVGVDNEGTVTTDESFIQMNSLALGGISTKQTFATAGPLPFNSQTLLNTGWANDGISPAINIKQSIVSTYLGVDYSSIFAFEQDRDAIDNVTGSYTDISQTLLNSSLLSNTPTTGVDVQKFVFRRASGARNPSAGSVTLGRVQGGQMGMGGMGGGMGEGMMGGGNGGTINWNAGDDVQVVWIGALCEGCGNGGMGGGGMGGGALDVTFSFQAFDNLVDSQDPIATASIIGSDPFTWSDPPFGVQPVLQ